MQDLNGYEIDDNWSKNLKAGDSVRVGQFGQLGNLRKVVRVTKTQIIVQSHSSETRFNRGSLKQVGSQNRGVWATCDRLFPITKEQIAQLQERQERRNLILQIEQVDMKNLKIEQLRAIEAIINS